MRRIALLLGAALAAGCSSGGSDRSVLSEGVRVGISETVHPITDKDALTGARSTRASWKADLLARAQKYPRKRFDNPNRSALMRHLRDFAEREGFDIVSAKVLRPRQDAPMIIVRTTHYLRLARATSGILKELDPRYPVRDDRRGWRYEGFYWEAEDERGVPFLIVSTLIRGQVEGQQWARSEPLFPYQHG